MFPSGETAPNEGEIFLLLIVLGMLKQATETLIGDYKSLLENHIANQRRLNRALPREKVRLTFEHFVNNIGAKHFRRMFRMTTDMFQVLCQKISASIGVDQFRSEAYLTGNQQGQPTTENEQPCPFISGELKVAISLRILAGGSYLDLVPLFGISSTHLYNVFGIFLEWILQTFDFPLLRLLRERNWDAMNELANAFGEKTDGVFWGPFAAIDGLAVRIKSPKASDARDPSNYWCRKGFYALNVQAICDRHKYFLWCYPANKGSTHDSAAFSASKLYDILEQMAGELAERGLFIVGDSAYILSAFMQIPFEKTEMKDDMDNARDAFNFYLSSCRINIECAFGELVMRWGIFWRTLQFGLKKNLKIVQVCMLLHNFILDHKSGDEEDAAYERKYFEGFDIEIDSVQRDIFQKTNEIPVALVVDNNEVHPGGRPTFDQVASREKGEDVRRRCTVALASKGLRRPIQHDLFYNKHGHVCIA